MTAHEILVAVELARRGAASAMIETVTGFGARWVRSIVRENGGMLSLKCKDPIRWFEDQPQRLLHAGYVLMAYEVQPSTETIGRKLLSAYDAYRRVAHYPGLLGINECAQVVHLYQSGRAWFRECVECEARYVVLSERTLCPLCRQMAREFCRGCQRPLPEVTGRSRAYCEECSPRSVRVNRRRTRQVAVNVSIEPAVRSSLLEHQADSVMRLGGAGLTHR